MSSVKWKEYHEAEENMVEVLLRQNGSRSFKRIIRTNWPWKLSKQIRKELETASEQKELNL